MNAAIIYEGKTFDNLPEFKKGDFGNVIYFHIKNNDGTIFNLTDYVITFLAKKLDYTIVDKYLIEEGCAITSATDGICTYTIKNTDLIEIGSFDCYLKLAVTGKEFKIPLGYLNIFDK